MSRLKGSFAARLREVRLHRKKTLEEVGQSIGTDRRHIAHFEGGDRRPSFDTLAALAHALDCSSDYLLGLNEAFKGSKNSTNLYRNIQSLTDADRSLAQDFVQLLARREKGKTCTPHRSN